MLFLVSAGTFRSVVGPGNGAAANAAAEGASAAIPGCKGLAEGVYGLPAYLHDAFGLQGLALTTDLLAGMDVRGLEKLRDTADKAGCPLLLLTETEPLSLGSLCKDKGQHASERLDRVLRAAGRLGCGSVAVTVSGDATEKGYELAIERFKTAIAQADRLELHVLLTPTAVGTGPLDSAERVTGLIKQVGGFRLGSLPDFQRAAQDDDMQEHLRQLAPYAQMVVASSVEFCEKGTHAAYDLSVGAAAMASIGYDGAIVLEYRGNGNPVEGIRQTLAAIEPALFEGSA